jgi:hypothetical protein
VTALHCGSARPYFFKISRLMNEEVHQWRRFKFGRVRYCYVFRSYPTKFILNEKYQYSRNEIAIQSFDLLCPTFGYFGQESTLLGSAKIRSNFD